ncbi:hypothetical protein FRB99_003683 [Tulasnella sp. 403]|nr:hypothetical protein FRB99_003683 [Tulasnella sp. 403]
MSSNKRRADEAERNVLEDLNISDEEVKALEVISKEQNRLEIIIDREAEARFKPIYEKRRDTLAKIDKFWPIAIGKHPELDAYIQINEDQQALSHLKDVNVIRDPKETRAFILEFHFEPNDFFSDAVLRKEYRYVAPEGAADETPDADGITPSMLEFDWEMNIEPQPCEIHWKSAAKNLVAKYPYTEDVDADAMDEETDMSEQFGSFFNLFARAADEHELGPTIADDLYPNAIDYFFGKHEDWEDEEEEEDSEDDDDDAEEIDLEKPRKKKGGRR